MIAPVEGKSMSGVTVATMIRSISRRLEPGLLEGRLGGGQRDVGERFVGAATRRSRIPVRSRIHSSEVSTIFAISSFVMTRSGACDPMPVIEMRPFEVAVADHERSTANVSVPRAASSPSTRASARPLPIGPRTRSRSHVSSSSSPGSTIRLKRTPSMPANSASRPRFSS